MKLKNKNYREPAVAKAEKAAAKLTEYMNNRPAGVEFVSFDDIRAAVDAAALPGVSGADLPDNLLAHVAQLAGFDVIEDE